MSRHGNPYRLWHGTPYGGFDSFADYKLDWAFFAPDEAGALQYAKPDGMLDSGLTSQRRPAGVTSSSPTIYEVDVDVEPERVFDTRRADHRTLYDEIRRETRSLYPDNSDEWLEKDLVRTVGPDRRWWGDYPGYGTAMMLIPYLKRRGFQASLASEGGSGVSFLLFDGPRDRVRVLLARPRIEGSRVRRNSDERLRGLERAWQASGADADRLAYFRELERTGKATKTDLRIRSAIERRSALVDAESSRATRRAEIEAMGEGWSGPDALEARHADGRPLTHPTLREALETTLETLASWPRPRVWVVIGDRTDKYVRSSATPRRYDELLGPRVAGTPWERESGHISSSAGPQPVWILVPNVRSAGGYSILVDSILEIADTKTGDVYWRHPSYDPALWVWEKAGRHKLEPWSESALERMVWLAQELGVRAGDLAMHTKLGVPSGRTRRGGDPVPPSLRSVIENALNVHGEDWTRQAIEDTARGRIGNPSA